MVVDTIIEVYVILADGTVCDRQISSDYSELSFNNNYGTICTDFFEDPHIMTLAPTSVQSTTVGVYNLDLTVTLLVDNSINWKIPVKVEVFCDFVDNAGCSHSYLPALDPTYSSITLCKDTDPNF